jgi:ligand-binding SRPBCC domain-containing protein
MDRFASCLQPAMTRTFQLTASQWVPRAPEAVFAYFADAFNLEDITPPWLRFRVLTPPPIKMGSGMEIDYRLRLRGLPLHWRSRISDWKPPFQFVDDQIVGPYRLWRHVHTFEVRDGGTCILDHVAYASAGGRLTNALFLRRDLRAIFTFRQQRLTELFGADANHPPQIVV